MKVAILTTHTPHHAYFVREVAKRYPVVLTVIETKQLSAPFATSHPFEKARDIYEWESWFDGKEVATGGFSPSISVESVNDPEAVQALRAAAPDIIFVFGTGKIKEEVISITPNRIFNLHGGNPEEYRGLDSHLWAIYHRDYAGIVVTLHRVFLGLDTGDVVRSRPIDLKQGMKLHELRRLNAELCVALTLEVIEELCASGTIVSTRQERRGRYYSFMPTDLKEICVKQFEAALSSRAP